MLVLVLVLVNGNKPNEVPRLCIRSNETLSPLDPLRLQMRGWGLVGGIIDACLGMSWRCEMLRIVNCCRRGRTLRSPYFEGTVEERQGKAAFNQLRFRHRAPPPPPPTSRRDCSSSAQLTSFVYHFHPFDVPRSMSTPFGR